MREAGTTRKDEPIECEHDELEKAFWSHTLYNCTACEMFVVIELEAFESE